MSDYQTILFDVDQSVAMITLNRPDRLNAFVDEMISEVTEALKRIERDQDIRAVLLTGAGKGFCAGQDLKHLGGDQGNDRIYEHLMQHYRPMIKRLHTLEKPVLAAINGPAAGAGASLALACDLRIMSKDAYLLEAFNNIGLVPDVGSTWFLVRLVGYCRAFELAVEAERIPAERCLALGLVNRLAEPDALLSEARAWAEKLAQRPTYAVGLTKRALNRAVTSTLMQAVEYEAHLQQLAAESEDFAEGRQAFIEKRPAVFKGR